MPLTEYSKQMESWSSHKNKKDPVMLDKLLSQAGRGGVQNCSLPPEVASFVQGAPYHTLLNALQNNKLSADGVVHDRGLAGASYVYFRIMKRDETPGTMAFSSVGSSHSVRMEFRPDIWTKTRGGYVCDLDGMGAINTTPFSQPQQAKTFRSILSLEDNTRGRAEMAIRFSVSMDDLISAWVQFKSSWDELERAPIVPPVKGNASTNQAVYSVSMSRKEEKILFGRIRYYLPDVCPMNKIRNSPFRWFKFYNQGGLSVCHNGTN